MQRVSERDDRKERYPVAVDATLHDGDGRKTPVRLTDFSNEGCRVEGCDGVHIGERLQIAIPRMGHVKAQVRWIGSGSAGVRFVAESDF